MNSIYRNNDDKSRYAKYYIKNQPSDNCVFCGIKNQEAVDTEIKLESLYVSKNSFPYNFWDMKEVTNHLMIIPKRHLTCMSELNTKESAEYLSLVKKYSSLGYDVFVRNKNSSIKTIQHLHIHLIKTKERNLGVEVEYRRLDEE